MQHAEEHVAVLEHLARYFDACDRADIDAVMRILAGATLALGDVETADPVVVRRAYESRQPAPAADGRRSTKHHVTNLVVEPGAEAGEVVASAYYFRLEPGPDGARVAASGRIRQVLLRDHDAWRVRRHTVISDF
jgi:ketosteroid isomerase-like protein